MNILPLFNRLLVELIVENTTESGIIVFHPDMDDSNLRKGRVQAVGPECAELKAENTIVFLKHKGVVKKIDNKEYIQMREYDVEGILEIKT